MSFRGIDTCVIYDFETMSQNPVDGVVVSFAMASYDPQRFADNPYTYQEILDKTQYMKFDVEDQVKNYNRKIEKDTLEWWSRQNKEAQKKLAPSADDKSIADLYGFFIVNKPVNLNKVYTRRNTFDPVFMTSLMKATGNPEPYDWWSVRDTISYIEGLSYGVDLNPGFIPEGLEDKFVKHDPTHDIAMDVMRMQALVQAVTAF
jgi:hypothetical protein